MNKDTALRLALEALEDACGDRCNSEYNPCFQREAITAIKAALEAKDEPVAWRSLEKFPPPIDQALDDASVSSRRHVLVTNNINATNRMGQPSHVWFISPQRVKEREWIGFTDSMQKVEALTHWLDPFDTTPPQRTWVGLTDEEIDVIYEHHHNQYGECESVNWGYERAIEAKLKEKNT